MAYILLKISHLSLVTCHYEKDSGGLRIPYPFSFSCCAHPHSQRKGEATCAKAFD